MTKLTMMIAAAGLSLSIANTALAAIDLDHLAWSVRYMIDTSQSDFAQPQSSDPRDNRGLAIDPTGQYLYAGYNDQYVRRIDLALSDYIDATDAQLTGVRGKGIAVDDIGRVYLAEGTSIEVYDAELFTHLFSLTGLTKTEGVAVTRESGQLLLYSADRDEGNLKKWLLAESGAAISAAVLDLSFGAGGSVSVPDDPRCVEVDGAGRAWVASKENNTLYRVAPDGSTLDSIFVGTPLDVDFDGDTVLVTRCEARSIARFDADTMSSLGADLVVPWVDLQLDPDGQDGNGSLSGIVVVPDVGFYVANESGQTADGRSTYGRIDAESGSAGGKFYTDLTHDDNDPILFAVAEPSALVLLGVAAVTLLACTRRRRPHFA